MEGVPNTLKIFIPSCALQVDTCILIGWRNEENSICCITNHISLREPDADLSKQIKDNEMLSDDTGGSCRVLGIWENDLGDVDPNKWKNYMKVAQGQSAWFHMRKNNSDHPECYFHGAWKCKIPSSNVITLVFDAEDVAASNVLEMHDPITNIASLSDGVNASLKQFSASQETDTECSAVKVESFIPFDNSWTTKSLDFIEQCVASFILLLAGAIVSICDNRFTSSHGNSLCRYLPLPATAQNLKHRARQIHSGMKLGKPSKLDRMRLTNILWKQGIDTFLGILVLYFLVAGDHTDLVADSLMIWAQTVASKLQDLLQWMMGVPAGLKLNHELAHFLGQFFIYHIYLWKGYLQFLAPLWSDAVWCVAVSGCLGVSFQVSFIQDLLSMMTLHSYCFYVYAARLYSLQVYGLGSLWRLFRGKKWNPLFQRVDLSSYDVDQLFIGTLLFTILLFLLPTIGLFYIVFTGLRLLVLAMQGFLYKCISFLDSIPVYLLYLRLFQPRKLAGDVRIHVLSHLPDRPLCYAIQLLPVSVSKLLHLVNTPTTGSRPPAYSWGHLMNKVFSGHLVYPWMESNKS